MRRRRADPEAPVPYEGWRDTITVELPEPKEQVTLRLDRDVLRWFRAKGRAIRPASTPSCAAITSTSARSPECDRISSRYRSK